MTDIKRKIENDNKDNENDIIKMRNISYRTYRSCRKYFCYMSNDILTEKEVKEIIARIDENNTDTYRVCFGTYDGKKWGVFKEF